MSVRRVLIYPDPFLRKPTVSIENLYKESRGEYQQVVDDMRHSLMGSGHGIALAANQIGFQWRGLVVLSAHPELSELCRKYGDVFWDVTYSPVGDEMSEHDEGCLSFPGEWIPVKRWNKIKVSCKDVTFAHIEFELDGGNRIGPARIFQHEIDHLDGKLMVDYLPTKKRLQIAKKMQKR
jgi:peptide deformylase